MKTSSLLLIVFCLFSLCCVSVVELSERDKATIRADFEGR